MSYDTIKKLLRQAESLAREDKLDEADAKVRECLKYGVTPHDISYNLSAETFRRLREHTK